MSETVWTQAFLQVNASNLSAYVRELSLNLQSESLDKTTMGQSSRVKKGGLRNDSLRIKFLQDFSAVDAVLQPLLGTTSCVEVRPTNVCSTAINPRYDGIWCLMSWPPFGGAVGSLVEAEAVFEPAGLVTRHTTAT